MHYNQHKPPYEFLDSLASNSYLPYLIQHSHCTSHSRTLINNIFSNVISKDISGNIIATISDSLPHPYLTLSPNTFADPLSNKSNVFIRDWPNLDKGNFVWNYFYFDIESASILNLDKKMLTLDQIISSMLRILYWINLLHLKKQIIISLDLKKVPHMTSVIQKPIYIKKKLLRNSSIKRLHKKGCFSWTV